MTHSVSTHLRIDVGEYDAAVRRFIPGYDAMLDHAAAAVAAVRPALVLDLGAGTGALADRLLRLDGDAIVELWDVDDEMLANARVRLADHADRARFLHRSFDDPFPPCDAIMGSLALHHVTTMEAKSAIYRRARAALRPGGALVVADATIPSEAPRQARSWRIWADHMVASGIDERAAWNHFDEWAAEDRYRSIEEELAALGAAGFDAQVAWQSGPMSVLVASTPR